MTPAFGAALIAVALGGAAIALQAPINAALGRAIGQGMFAAAISFGVGFAILLVLSVARGAVPSVEALRSAPWWCWTGGALGACYVWASIWSVPKLGVVTLVAALVFGQLACAIALDASGAFGLPVREIGWQRIVAVLLVAGGLVMSRL